jgi:hypothetical protein
MACKTTEKQKHNSKKIMHSEHLRSLITQDKLITLSITINFNIL